MRVLTVRNKRITPILLILAYVLTGCNVNDKAAPIGTQEELYKQDNIQESAAVIPLVDSYMDADELSDNAAEATVMADATALREEASDQYEGEVNTGDSRDSISIIMVGDVLLHDSVNGSFCQTDGSYDYTNIFANTVDEISAADLAIVNQEVIIGGRELEVTGYPSFNAPYEIGDALAAAGFDVVCHATNHALDRNKQGIINCLSFWETNYPDMGVVGIYGSKEDRDSIYIYEKKGIKIAVLNYTYGTNGVKMPSDMPYAVNLLEEERLAEDIRLAESEVDFTIVCPHWGTEYMLEESTEQVRLARLMVHNGADLIIGTHPHVIEPIDWIEDEETGNRGLVYYSLGNYVNWTAGKGEGVANRMVGAMARVNVTYGDSGDIVVGNYDVEALVSHVTPKRGEISVYRLVDYDSGLAESNAIIGQDSNFSRDYCIDLCNNVFGDIWK